MADSPGITRHLRVYGRVQGVYFRESMNQKAAQLGITGWVRNRLDGTLEALIQGEPRLLNRCWSGPATGRLRPESNDWK